ncbi:transcriptional repressor [Lutibacter sp. B2]|nr:transcriptional repressor [Lutibacter sp. B2]
MNLNVLLNKLKANGYKTTEQRKVILQVLVSNDQNLISVETILSKSKEMNPKTNMSTVYRNLEILEKLDLLYKVIAENGMTLYKLACSDKHHHHLICKGCGKTEVIDFCPLKSLIQLSKEKNFNLTEHKLELYGYCKDCEYNKKQP